MINKKIIIDCIECEDRKDLGTINLFNTLDITICQIRNLENSKVNYKATRRGLNSIVKQCPYNADILVNKSGKLFLDCNWNIIDSIILEVLKEKKISLT